MNPSPRPRGAVVIVRDGSVALIRRVNDRGLYYVFPGGGVEGGESPQEAAVREAHEELGLDVRILGLLAVVTYRERDQYFYAAEVVGGVFGTGTGPEFSYPSHLGRGSYTPVWVPLEQLRGLKVYPRALADFIEAGVKELPATPLRIVEDAELISHGVEICRPQRHPDASGAEPPAHPGRGPSKPDDGRPA